MLKSSGFGGLENRSESPMAGSGGCPQNRELDVVVSEEHTLGSSDGILLIDHNSPDDGDGVGRGSVITAHFHIQLADGSIQGDISELFVHIVNAYS